MFVDFKEVKERVSFDDVISFLELKLSTEGHQYRGACPCEKGGERALVITPSKGWYCFGSKQGGDVIGLTAHIKRISAKDAGAYLAERLKAPEVPEKKNGEDFQPLAYLDATHELVIALGFTPEICEAAGIGFAPKGSMRGNVLIPLRLPNGHLVGYVGVQGEVTLPKEWRLS